MTDPVPAESTAPGALLGRPAHATLVADRIVAVVTDSAANLPPELAAELDVEIVPLYLRFGERSYRDGLDLAPEGFYRRLVPGGEPASTSSPSPGDFLAAFERTRQRDVVCITVASGMSASFQGARLGAERFHGRVVAVDSLSASMAQGFVVKEAAALALNGAGIQDVAARAREVAARTWLIATVDTFEFLRKSGRVSALQAYAATMLDIKPVFRFHQGEVTPVARPRTRRRALDRVVAETLGIAGERPLHLAAIHAAAAADAEWVAGRIDGQASVVERLLVEVTPVIGAHTGPGLVGTAFFTD